MHLGLRLNASRRVTGFDTKVELGTSRNRVASACVKNPRHTVVLKRGNTDKTVLVDTDLNLDGVTSKPLVASLELRVGIVPARSHHVTCVSTVVSPATVRRRVEPVGELEAVVCAVARTERSRIGVGGVTAVVPVIKRVLRVHQTKANLSLVADVKRKVLTGLVNSLRSLETVEVARHLRAVDRISDWVNTVTDKRSGSSRTARVSYHSAVGVRDNNRCKCTHGEQLVQSIHHVLCSTGNSGTVDTHTGMLDVAVVDFVVDSCTVCRNSLTNRVDSDKPVGSNLSFNRVHTPLATGIRQDGCAGLVKAEVNVNASQVRTTV